MKLITRDTDYALRALMYMAQKPNQLVSAGELVKKIKIPRPFLRKILQTLQLKGILTSTKGKGGGFSLRQMLKNIRVTDIMKIFQKSLHINKCVFKKLVCPNIKTCALNKKIAHIEKIVINELNKITIASLVKIS